MTMVAARAHESMSRTEQTRARARPILLIGELFMADSIFSSAADTVTNTVNGHVGAAVNAIDAKRAPIASSIDAAATSLHAGADSLESTASWLRNKNVRDMWSDVEGTIKDYPVAALLGAVVVGFAAG